MVPSTILNKVPSTILNKVPSTILNKVPSTESGRMSRMKIGKNVDNCNPIGCCRLEKEVYSS